MCVYVCAHVFIIIIIIILLLFFSFTTQFTMKKFHEEGESDFSVLLTSIKTDHDNMTNFL